MTNPKRDQNPEILERQRESAEKQQTPESFASETARRFEILSNREGIESPRQKIKERTRKWTDSLLKQYEKMHPVAKTAIAIAGGILAFKVLKFGIEKIIDLGKWVTGKFESLAKGTWGKIEALKEGVGEKAFYGLLAGIGIPAAGALTVLGVLKAHMTWPELLKLAKTRDISLVREKLTELVRAGKIKLDEKWDSIAGKFWGKEELDKLKAEAGGESAEVSPDEEQVPLSEALGNYEEGLKAFLAPFVQYLENNKEVLALTAVAVAPAQVFSAVKGGAILAKDTLFSLAGMAQKVAFKFPVASLLAVSGVVLAGRAHASERIMVPKKIAEDPEALKVFLREKVKQSSEAIQNADLTPEVVDEKLDQAVEFIVNPSFEKLKEELKDLPGKVIEGTIEYAGKTLNEKIHDKNKKGLNSFQLDLQVLKADAKGVEKQVIEDFMAKLKELEGKEKLLPKDIDMLQEYAQKLGMIFVLRDGIWQWNIVNEDGIAEIKDICIDPSLSATEAEAAVKYFMPSPGFQSTLDVALKPMSAGKDYIQGVIAEASGEGIETEEQTKTALGGLLKKGWTIVYVGGKAVLWDGGAEKYALGARNFVDKIILDRFRKDKTFELSAAEYLIDYGQGLVPVVMLGIASSLLKFQNPLGKKALLRSALYPYTGFKASLEQVIKPVLKGDFAGILRNPRVQVKAGFFGRLAQVQKITDAHLPTKLAKAVYERRSRLENLYKAISLASQGLEEKANADKFFEDARALLSNRGNSAAAVQNNYPALNASNAEQFIEDVKGVVQHERGAIGRLKRAAGGGVVSRAFARVGKAKEKVSEGAEALSKKTYGLYERWARMMGKEPLPYGKMSSKVARIGGKAFGPAITCIMLHQVLTAENKAEELVKMGAWYAVFSGAMRLPTWQAKAAGVIAGMAGVMFIPEKYQDDVAKAITKAATFNNSAVASDVLSVGFGGGPIIDVVHNISSTGNDVREFLDRQAVGMDLKSGISRYYLNGVSNWNKRKRTEIEKLKKQPQSAERDREIAYQRAQIIDEDWDRVKALDLEMKKKAAERVKQKIIKKERAAEGKPILERVFFGKKMVDKAHKLKKEDVFDGLFVEHFTEVVSRGELDEYIALQQEYLKDLDFYKRIHRYNEKWENKKWILGEDEGNQEAEDDIIEEDTKASELSDIPEIPTSPPV